LVDDQESPEKGTRALAILGIPLLQTAFQVIGAIGAVVVASWALGTFRPGQAFPIYVLAALVGSAVGSIFYDVIGGFIEDALNTALPWGGLFDQAD